MGGVSRLIGTIKRKPARAADGLTDEEAGFSHAKDTSVMHDLRHLSGHDKMTLAHALKDLTSGEPMDDRKLMLENGVSMLQSLPSNSGLSHTISDGFIGMLWNDQPHPAATMIGPEFKYRKADGSGNNPHFPDMGKAGSPYARTVPPVQPKMACPPDPELVFDQLLRRREFKEHPSGLNRLFFSFATIVIHECFATNRTKPWINDTSSYVDLSTLYGNNQEEQNQVRTFKDGQIHPDTISSNRIMMMPNGVVAILILFARNHNHIASRLLAIDESGNYHKDTSKMSAEQKAAHEKWVDKDVFQLSRNVNVGFFASVVLKDYVSAILNTVRADSDWNLDLGKEIKQMGGQRLSRGTGNNVSCEFAVLYHWHASLSAADEKWMENVLKAGCPEKSVDEITVEDFKKIAMKHGMQLASTPPSTWTFGGYERDAEGRFSDEVLAELLYDCVEEPAHALGGGRGTPSSLRIVDILGQLQARGAFNVCTMNEFRKYLNLKPFDSFIEWNSDPEIANAAEALYGRIDQLELYPGLMAEEAKPTMPGSGVQPGHTIGRGILDDAVALVRGDRFLTHDFNSSTLTSWGVNQLQSAPGAYGGILAKILFTNLPNRFPGSSTYALLPFYTPKAIRSILHKNKKLDLYDTDRPKKGLKNGAAYGVKTYEGIKKVFADRDTFRVPYEKSIKGTLGYPFMICFDDETRHNEAHKRLAEAFFEPDFSKHIKEYFTKTTQAALKKHILAFSNSSRRQIDVVRDVCNVVPTLWVAQKIGIPIKSEETPHGIMSQAELRLVLLVLFIWFSFDVIPAAHFGLKEAANEHAASLVQILEARLKTNSGIKEKIHDALAKGTSYEVSEEADHLYHTLLKSKQPIPSLAADILGMVTPVIGNQTQQSALLVDLFLSEGYEYAKERIIELAHKDTEEADEELKCWVREGMRVAPVVLGVPRMTSRDVTVTDGDGRSFQMKAGEKMIIGIAKAHLDPSAFPNPERLDPTRPKESYLLMGNGLHYCFGAPLVYTSIAMMLKQIFKLKNIRRAPGSRFVKISEELGEATAHLYLDNTSNASPVPSSLRIEYDE